MAAVTRIITFDLDGVLIDSDAAIREAYRAAGVVIPDWAKGKHASSWLPKVTTEPEQAHLQKQLIYSMMLQEHAKPLAGVTVLREVQRRGFMVFVVTHCSKESARDALQFLGLTDVAVANTHDKAFTLDYLKPLAHIDDHEVPRSPVPVIEYVDDVATLLREIERWTQ